MIKAGVGLNLAPDDARFEAGDPIPDIDSRVGKDTVIQWLADGTLVSDEPVAKPRPKAKVV